MNLIKTYDANGNKCLTEGVTHAELESLKLTDLEESTLQDRLVEALNNLEAIASLINARQHSGCEVRPSDWSNLYHECQEARALLASLEATTK